MKKEDAIKLFGSEANLAKALGVSRSAVNQWVDEVPPLRAYQIRDLLDTKVSPVETAQDPVTV